MGSCEGGCGKFLTSGMKRCDPCTESHLSAQIEQLRLDKERLDWLEEQLGSGLLSDDFGRWVVSDSGIQNQPEDEDSPFDCHTAFFIEKNQWQESIRRAIDEARAQEKKEQDNATTQKP